MNIIEIKNSIDKNTYMKGNLYYLENRIKDITYNKFTSEFSASIIGTYDYKTKIVIKKGNVQSFNCDCPVDGLCKHVAAFLIQIKNDHKLLINALSNGIEKIEELNKLNYIKEKQNFDEIDIDHYFNLLLSFYQQYKGREEINQLEPYFKLPTFNPILPSDEVFIIYQNFQKISEYIKKEDLETYVRVYIKSVFSVYEYNVALKQLIAKNENNALTNMYIRALIKEKPSLFLNLDIENKAEYLLETALLYEDDFLPFETAYTKIKPDIEKTIQSNERYQSFQLIEELGKAFNYEKLAQLETIIGNDRVLKVINKLNFKITNIKDALNLKQLSGYQIDYTQYEDQMDQFIKYKEEIIKIDLDNFINYIYKHLDNKYFYKTKINYDALFEIIQAFNLIDKKLEKENYIELVSRNMITPVNTIVINEGGLPKKMVVGYRKTPMMPGKQDYKIIIEVLEDSFSEKLTLVKKINSKWEILVEGIVENRVLKLATKNKVLENEALEIFNQEPQKEVDDAFLELTETIEKKRTNNIKKQLLNQNKKLIERLSESIVEETKVLMDEKISIKPVLLLSGYFSNHQLVSQLTTLSLRIKGKREYVVKHIPTFIDNINNDRQDSYGKGLSFYHYIEQFDHESQEIISILETYKDVYPYKSYTAIEVSQKNLEKLIDVTSEMAIEDLEKNYLENDAQSYYKEKDYEVKINLSKDKFNLNLSDSLSQNHFIIRLEKIDLYIDQKNRTFAKIIYQNNKQRELTHFILDNPDFNVSYVLDELSSKVIPLIRKEVELSNDLIEYTKKFSVEIKSYFDYDKETDEITVLHKYYQGEIEIEKIMDYPIYQNTLNNYFKVLEQFGFQDSRITNPKNIVQFLTADLTPIKEHATVYIEKTLAKMTVKKTNRISIQVSTHQGMLKTHIEQTDLDEKLLKKVLKAYQEGKSYILLEDQVILTDTEEIVALSEFIEHNNLDISRLFDDNYTHPMYHLFKFSENSQYLNVEVENELKEIIYKIKNFDNKEITNPPHVYSMLKNYQISGFKWLQTLYELNLGGILADDMGLGKTLQIISLFESIETKGLLLVVCPKSLVYNWKNELEKFKASFDHLVYSGSKEYRDEVLLKMKEVTEKTLVITSYDTLRNDVENFESITFDTVILDEAQHIKNLTALKTKAVKDIKALHKFVLTGTPLENAISDLWSIFDFLMPGYLYSYNKFKKIEQKATADDKKALDFIVDKTRPFILRRTKKNVLKELPDKEEKVIYGEFEKEEQQIYDAYLLKVKQSFEEEKSNKIDFLADLIKLRQLCLSPELVYETFNKNSSKIDLTVEIIENAISSGHKVLVFSSFVKALELVKKRFKPEDFFMLTGQTEGRQRVEMANQFNQAESQQKVFFISLKAGGTGLNLTGADIVIHLDPWWNLAAENQATDRAHRIGQENKVTVYKIIMKSSIEEKVLELQEKKKELFERIIDGSEEQIAKLSDEDYKFLLE
ncbi:Superfamily II DNA/RNA helicases, SNF2-related [Alteracholeplasma palmae J233]|uniref:Superfamily II DNA/RNA helicases, SNF2-related n=1 Tax=Alteracholeplasma palmae (strain ATCC 49389 / J233) TaxID=1318466 RepID=U4KK92_ALTPJ|nr:DEAD/DEAH box helicase [Alteracholeplasma palmae]CCV64109.1 Superfamily II DNA/RNA helicases, SNF2-related [Alteracholeplasma palmae J233]